MVFNRKASPERLASLNAKVPHFIVGGSLRSSRTHLVELLPGAGEALEVGIRHIELLPINGHDTLLEIDLDPTGQRADGELAIDKILVLRALDDRPFAALNMEDVLALEAAILILSLSPLVSWIAFWLGLTRFSRCSLSIASPSVPFRRMLAASSCTSGSGVNSPSSSSSPSVVCSTSAETDSATCSTGGSAGFGTTQ
jgi:hypothetical protein